MRPLFALGVLSVALGSAQPTALSTEFDRLGRDIVSSIPEADRGGIAARFERGRAALAGGRLYLALFDLQSAYEAEAGYRLSGEAARIPNYEAFKARWSQMGPPMTAAFSSKVPAPPASVHFIEALAQSSEGRAAATYRASLPYAQDAGLAAGLYYLGESHAMIRFAALCRALEDRPNGPAAALQPVGPALRAHEAAVVKAYDLAAQPLRPRFAQVHVAIKLAHTLNDRGQAEGALLQYLISRYRYALVKREGTPAPPVAALGARLKSTTLPADADHSTAEFFLQLAAANLAAKEPIPHGAAAVLDDIIPAYLELVKR